MRPICELSTTEGYWLSQLQPLYFRFNNKTCLKWSRINLPVGLFY